MKKQEYDIIVAGNAIVDVPVGPVNNELLLKPRVPVQSIKMHTGGDGINQAMVLSALGKKPYLISKLGDDLVGSFIINECEKNGVETKGLKIDPNIETGMVIVLIDEDGERRFVTSENSSLRKLTTDDIEVSGMPSAKIFSFASIFIFPLITPEKLEMLFKNVKERGYTVCTDVKRSKNGETLEDIKGALRYVDYIFPNNTEAEMLTGEKDVDRAADMFLDCGVKNVIIKTGAGGCLIKNRSERYEVPAVPDTNCIDTTGAGDTFAAAFITGLSENKSFLDCAIFANAAASLAVEAMGATGNIHGRGDIEKRVEIIKSLL